MTAANSSSATSRPATTHGAVSAFWQRLTLTSIEQLRLWRAYGVAVGRDGSIMRAEEICFLLDRRLPVQVIVVDYPYGFVRELDSVFVQDIYKVDYPAEDLISARVRWFDGPRPMFIGGFVASKLARFIKIWRERRRELRRVHAKVLLLAKNIYLKTPWAHFLRSGFSKPTGPA